MFRTLLSLFLFVFFAACATSPVDETSGPGFVLVEIASIDDPTGFGDYSLAAGPTLMAHNFIPVVATPVVERLDGSSPEAWSVVIQFSDLAAAQAWYDDPEYVAARPLRLGSTGSTHFVLAEGTQAAANADHAALDSYVYLHVDSVTDPATFEDYRKTTLAGLKRLGAVPLIDASDHRLLEGDKAYAWTLLVGFPSSDALQQWRNDPETKAAELLRAASSTGASAVVLPSFDPSMFQ